MEALPQLNFHPAPWTVASSGVSVNMGLYDGSPKLRFEDRRTGLRNAALVAAAPSIYNLNLELIVALVDAPRDAVVEEALGIACDQLASIHYHNTIGGKEAARALRRAVGLHPEPHPTADGGPLWLEDIPEKSKRRSKAKPVARDLDDELDDDGDDL
jgi:hypothetical protein